MLLFRNANTIETSNPDEAPRGEGAWARRIVAWVVLGLLVVAHAAFNALLCPVGRPLPDRSYLFGVGCIGATLAQPSLLAVWAVLGHRRLSFGLPFGMLLVVLMSYAAVVRGVTEDGSPEESTTTVFMFAMLFLVMQAVMWIPRAWFGWRVVAAWRDPMPPGPGDTQFSLKELLAWITVAAMLFALGSYVLQRRAWPSESVNSVREVSLLAASALTMAVLSLPAIGCVWITLAGPGPARACVWAIAVAPLAVIAAIALFGQFLGVPGLVELGLALGACLVGLCASAVATAIPVRLCGFRLLRVGSNRAAG